MISAIKLKKIRLLRGMTQKEVALKSDLTPQAIRNYELGYRSPDDEQLKKIAEALQCDVSALVDHTPISIFEFMQILFDYEKDLKLRPLIEGTTVGLMSHDRNLNDFLLEWEDMRRKHYNGEISDEEFDDWKLSYPKKSINLKK